jgi:hypothetical protein
MITRAAVSRIQNALSIPEVKSKIVGISSALDAIKSASEAYRAATEKPDPKLIPIFINPEKDRIAKRIEEGMKADGEGILSFFHGTSHIDPILAQAQANEEGKLDHRSCDRGDAHLGLYGTACPKATVLYSGAKYLVEVGSPKNVEFDPARGTAALGAFVDKHVMAVYHVANIDEILSHERPSFIKRVSIAVDAALSTILSEPSTKEATGVKPLEIESER